MLIKQLAQAQKQPVSKPVVTANNDEKVEKLRDKIEAVLSNSFMYKDTSVSNGVGT